MHIRKLFAGIVFSIALLGFIPSPASAQTCEDIGGSCRPGWISGCSFPESPRSELCPLHVSGFLVCCIAPQAADACNAGGGTCRSDYYDINFPSEPACGYGTGVPSPLACGGGPGRMCCLPPPNVGAICNGGPDTCQLPGNCPVGGYADGACFGGTVCCPPPPSPTLGSFVVPASCTIAVGASDCSITVSWLINNPVAPALRQDGNLISNLASSPGLAATLSFGLNIFELSDGATSLSIKPASAVCAAGSSWNGALCAATPPPPAACTGVVSGDAGTCRATCLVGEFADTAAICGVTDCCTPSGPPPPAACTGVVSGDAGTCRATCLVGEFADTAFVCGVTDCCTPLAPPPPAACTGVVTGDAGICRGTCLAGEFADTAFVCGVSDCCTSVGPPPPPAACTGAASGSAGTCRGTCLAGEFADVDGTNCPGISCCVGSGPPPPPPPVPGGPVNFLNPLKFDNINALVCAFLSFLQGFIVVLALIMIVIGGFLYIASAGIESRMTLAKNTILGALIGLALGIATPAILKEVGIILGWAGFAACAGVGTVLSLLEIAKKVLDFLLATVGVVSIIMLVVGAFMYLTAAGDEGRIDTGKSIVKYSIIGITIALAALVLVRLVAGFF